MIDKDYSDYDKNHQMCVQKNGLSMLLRLLRCKLGEVTVGGVETLLFPSIHCPVITDPPLLS